MVWSYDVPSGAWIAEPNFVFHNNLATVSHYGASSATAGPWVMIAFEQITGGPFAATASWELWHRNGPNSWSEIVTGTTVYTDTTSTAFLPPQVSMAATPTPGVYATAAASTAISTGDTSVELGFITAGGSYGFNRICGDCAIDPFVQCPTGWGTFTGGIDYCAAATSIGLGVLVAVDQQDGLHAVISDSVNRLYFFSFNPTVMHWMFLSATAISGIDPAGFSGMFPPSIAMWNGLTAWGSPELAQTSPPLSVNSSSNCNATATGYVKYLTWDGFSTWTLQPTQLVDPNACSANNCGASVAVGPDGTRV